MGWIMPNIIVPVFFARKHDDKGMRQAMLMLSQKRCQVAIMADPPAVPRSCCLCPRLSSSHTAASRPDADSPPSMLACGRKGLWQALNIIISPTGGRYLVLDVLSSGFVFELELNYAHDDHVWA